MKITDEYIANIIVGKDHGFKLILSELTDGKSDFLDLIRAQHFELKDGLSSRMRWFYNDKGLLYSEMTDTTNTGKKHKLSFEDVIWIEILDKVKGRKGVISELLTIKDMLTARNCNSIGISILELYLMVASVYLYKSNDYELDLRVDGECSLNPIIGEFTDTNRRINLSQSIRNVLFDSEGNLKLSDKSKKFIMHYIAIIDHYRSQLYQPLLSEGVSYVYRPMKDRFQFSPTVTSKLFKRPGSPKFVPDIIYEDQDGNTYGIELKLKILNTKDTDYAYKITDIARSWEEVSELVNLEIDKFMRFVDRRKQK